MGVDVCNCAHSTFLSRKRCIFHYVPLHSAKAGMDYGRFNGEDKYTTVESERLIRLPMWYGQKEEEASKIIAAIQSFFGKHVNRASV